MVFLYLCVYLGSENFNASVAVGANVSNYVCVKTVMRPKHEPIQYLTASAGIMSVCVLRRYGVLCGGIKTAASKEAAEGCKATKSEPFQ